jgi:hypothetical protein
MEKKLKKLEEELKNRLKNLEEELEKQKLSNKLEEELEKQKFLNKILLSSPNHGKIISDYIDIYDKMIKYPNTHYNQVRFENMLNTINKNDENYTKFLEIYDEYHNNNKVNIDNNEYLQFLEWKKNNKK